jgi:transmembrane sensor
MSTRSFWNHLRHALGGYPTTAADWAVRVQSADVTRDELLVLDSWLKADPKNADAYARVAKVGHLAMRLREHREEVARLAGYQRLRVAERAQRASRQPRRSIWSYVAAACLIVVLLVTFLLRSPPDNVYVAKHGEQRNVTLADGSHMLVNTESEARVRFDRKVRVVELPRGEAFFEVTKIPSRPFIVRAGNIEVRAVGTKFSVRRDAREVRVVVTEGRVRVSRMEGSAGSQDLSPGHALSVPAAGQTLVPEQLAVNAERETAWASGTVEFENAPLAQVVRELNRYTTKPFVVADPALEEIHLSGRFKVGDMESVQFALKDRFGIEAVNGPQAVTLTGGR